MSESDDVTGRKWVCPDCGHEEKRYPASKIRPICEKCDWRDAVHIEMVAQGPGRGKFMEHGGDL